ncbi:MAG TPA: tetratricopeptide repeat protein [Pirellulales bacterium]
MDPSVDQPIASDCGGGESAGAQALLPAGADASPPIAERAPAIWVWAICGFLLLAVGLVFGQTVGHAFLGFDDQTYVYENPHVTPGLRLPGLWWALTDGPFGEWYPLTAVSHMLDCQIYGIAPAGHYLTNVLLHGASSVLLFLVLLRMTGDVWPSAWVAAIFAIHPLHVESVAWLAERRDVLSGLFFMLTLGAYALYTEWPSLPRYLAVAGFLALGLMSKPIVITVPFLLLLLDHWPLDRFRHVAGTGPATEPGSWFGGLSIGWRLVVEKIPLLALAAAGCGITLWTHASTQATNPADRLSLATRLANALVSYATYLGQTFCPIDLAPFYPHPGTHLPMAWVAGAAILLAAISVAAACCWRRLPYLLVGWLWFLGMLVPVIGLIQIAAHSRADRYTYLSQIGLSIALAWGVWRGYESRQSLHAASWLRRTLAAAAGGAVLLLGGVAWRQTSYWRNAETLWTHTLACTEHNALAQINYAHCCTAQGKTDEAIAHLREAVAAGSINRLLIADCHDFLAASLTTQGKIDEALAQYKQAVRVFPEGAIFHARLAVALNHQEEFKQAIVEFREILRLNPTFPQARLGLADALLAGGEPREAAAQCRAILEREPDSAGALVTLGAALVDLGRAEEAVPHFERALDLQPQYARAHFHLGLALYALGQTDRAVDELSEALRLRPDNPAMLWHTAWILATSPNPAVRNGARGVRLANRAIELSGGREVRAYDALAAALAETERFPAAVEAAGQASKLALDRHDDALAGAIDERIRLYRQGLPYREPASPISAEDAPVEAAPAKEPE